jgi:hypothetical protein
MKWIGIIGTRRRNTNEDFKLVEKAFLEEYEDGDMLVSGGCWAGGDRFAEILAKEYQVPIMIHYARWNQHGKAAGFIRNGDIAKQSDVLIACASEDRTGGTEDTINKYVKKEKGGLKLV